MTGVSGVGIVVWGVQWPDGTCSYRWNSRLRTFSSADSVDIVREIHGHDGATRLLWLDSPENAAAWQAVDPR
uniref:hypothetical protein n=1 Tax=Nonomuraea sp. CA-251285 TaxID=3240002 RepID=UPI003F49ADF1